MTAEELQSIRDMMREELIASENKIVARNDEKLSETKKEIMYGVDEKLSETEKRIMRGVDEKLSDTKKEIMHGVAVLLDTEFKTNYGLLADEIHAIGERTPTIDDMDIIDDRLQDLEDSEKQQNLEIAALKKAQ